MAVWLTEFHFTLHRWGNEVLNASDVGESEDISINAIAWHPGEERLLLLQETENTAEIVAFDINMNKVTV